MKDFFLQLAICNEINKTCGSLFYMPCLPACWSVPPLHGVEDETHIMQDYLDNHDTKDVKDMIGAALYPYLCEVCFSLSAPKTSVDLRCTVRNMLLLARPRDNLTNDHARRHTIFCQIRLLRINQIKRNCGIRTSSGESVLVHAYGGRKVRPPVDC